MGSLRNRDQGLKTARIPGEIIEPMALLLVIGGFLLSMAGGIGIHFAVAFWQTMHITTTGVLPMAIFALSLGLPSLGLGIHRICDSAYRRCLNCGARNASTRTHCVFCGRVLG
jgi:hypothetical protein